MEVTCTSTIMCKNLRPPTKIFFDFQHALKLKIFVGIGIGIEKKIGIVTLPSLVKTK